MDDERKVLSVALTEVGRTQYTRTRVLNDAGLTEVLGLDERFDESVCRKRDLSLQSSAFLNHMETLCSPVSGISHGELRHYEVVRQHTASACCLASKRIHSP